MSEPNLNPNEVKVLAALASVAQSDGGYLSFRAIGHRVKLKHPAIRLACRSLKRKGLAQFAVGLWTEDGEMRGSGYAATQDGEARADDKLVNKIVTRMWC